MDARISYALVEIDNKYYLIKVKSDDPESYVKENYCKYKPHCHMVKIYDELQYNEKYPAGHFVVNCCNKKIIDNIHELGDTDEFGELKREYQSDYQRCFVRAEFLNISTIEADIISYYRINNGDNASKAIRFASFVMQHIVNLAR